MSYVDPVVAVSFKDAKKKTKTTKFIVGTHLFSVGHVAVERVKVVCTDNGNGQPRVKIILEP